ncbi:MAG: dihydroorotate dehydrogenase [Candidatus Odinarchaeota archaeon]|nr:dihydroorotate dehydrogenase [Candidatus Odinarchaeota archaeon]
MTKVNLETEICGIKLKNPLVLASGILGNTADLLFRVAKAGAGAVTTKSIGPHKNEGHKGPNIVEVNCGYINAMGLPNPGVEIFKEEIRGYKEMCDTPLIASVFGTSEEEFAYVASELYKAGADLIELNVSCPHSKEGILNIGLSPRATERVIKKVKEAINAPLLLKVPGNTNIGNLRDVVSASVNAGIDGFTAINTLPAMVIDIETQKSILGFGIGGLSGPAIKPVAVRIVYEIRKITDLPIIGVGGVSTYEDAIEFLLAGANAVGIGTALTKDKDLKIFKEILQGLISYMEKKGIRSIKDISGLIAKKTLQQ